MLDIEPKLVNQSEIERQKVLKAVQDDKWLTILEPPHNTTQISPKKQKVLDFSSNLLGRLSIASHVAFEQAHDSDNLLKANRDLERFQYAIPNGNKDMWNVVYLKGYQHKAKKLGLLTRFIGHHEEPKSEYKCMYVRNAVVPEYWLEKTRHRFLGAPNHEWLNPLPMYRSDDENLDVFYPIHEALNSAAIFLGLNGRIEQLAYSELTSENIKAVSYNFDWQSGNVEARHFEEHNYNDYNVRNWDYLTCSPTKTFMLYQDGIMKTPSGEESPTSLEEQLVTIVQTFPIRQYMTDR